MFRVFHLAWSTWSATETFVAGRRNAALGLVDCQNASRFVAHQVVSLMKNEQQSQNLLHKVDLRSTFRNNFLQPATNVFVAQQVDYARWKTGNIDQNLQPWRNNVARQVEGFCISYFAAFMGSYIDISSRRYPSILTSRSLLRLFWQSFSHHFSVGFYYAFVLWVASACNISLHLRATVYSWFSVMRFPVAIDFFKISFIS